MTVLVDIEFLGLDKIDQITKIYIKKKQQKSAHHWWPSKCSPR